MKTKLFSKARITGATLILLTVGLVMGFAETGSEIGCPEATSGYLSKGERSDKPCQHSIVEKGYYWFIDGDVKWVGTIFAEMKGSYKEGTKTILVNGTEYICDGYSKVCWVCNCYSIASPTMEN